MNGGGEPPVTGVDRTVSGSHRDGPSVVLLIAPLGPHLAPGRSQAAFPEARALQYSPERRWAYLPCSGWVREEPHRYGRLNADPWIRTTWRTGRSVIDCVCVRALQLTPGSARRSRSRHDECWLRPVSARGLNTSLPRCVHPESIELVFYEWSQAAPLFQVGFGLRCVQPLPRDA